jgi:hypothetical protein
MPMPASGAIFEEVGGFVERHFDALAGRRLAARDVALEVIRPAALPGLSQLAAQALERGLHGGVVGAVGVGGAIDSGAEGMRWVSVPRQ